jgi:hypothetical protein
MAALLSLYDFAAATRVDYPSHRDKCRVSCAPLRLQAAMICSEISSLRESFGRMIALQNCPTPERAISSTGIYVQLMLACGPSVRAAEPVGTLA